MCVELSQQACDDPIIQSIMIGAPVSHSLSTRIFDVTIPFSADLPVWPGDPAIELRPLARTADGDPCNTTQIVCPTHCGTHVDPPFHFIHQSGRLDDIPIERWVGACQVVHIPDEVTRIEPEHLESAGIAAETTRLLFKTSNSRRWASIPLVFETDYVALTPAAARWIVERGLKLIGIDYFSFECFDDAENETHRTILGNDVIAIEALDLREIQPGFYQLVCLPLKIASGDGAPARVILISNE